MKLFRFAAAILAITVSAAGGRAWAAPSNPFDIDVVMALTGPGAFLGKDQRASYTALEALENKKGGIKGRPIRFVFHDDQTNPQVAVQLISAIVAAHPAVILGPNISATCRATIPLITNGPVLYCLSPAIAPAKGSFEFSVSVSTKDVAKVMVRYYRLRGLTRIATLTSTDATGQDFDNQFSEALSLPENEDVQAVAREHFSGTDVSVNAQIIKILAANPQVLIAWTTGTPLGTVLRAIADSALNVPVATSNENMSFTQLKQYGSIVPAELDFPGQAYVLAPTGKMSPALAEFRAATRSLGPPDLQLGIAWDAARFVIAGFRKLGTDATADQLRSYLTDLHDADGIMGTYDFRDGSNRGISENGVAVMRWDPGKESWSQLSRFGGAPLK